MRLRVLAAGAALAMASLVASADPAVAQGNTGGKAARPAPRWTIDGLVQMAVDRHPSVKAQQAMALGADADVDSARWQFAPSATVGGQAWTQGGQGLVQVQMPVWSFGRLEAGLAFAREKFGAANAGVEQQRYAIAGRVMDQYLALQKASEARRVFSAGVEQMRQMEAMIRRRVESTVSPQSDLELVRARISQMLTLVINADAAEKAAAAALSQLVGENVFPGSIALSDGLAAQYRARPLDGSVVERSVAASPVLRKSQADVRVAEAQAEQVRTQPYPTISVQGQYNGQGYQQPYVGAPLPGTSVTLNLQFSPGAGLSAFSQRRSAKAQIAAARDSFEAYRSDLIASVSSDYQNYRAAEAAIVQMEVNRKESRLVVESYQRAFYGGTRSWLDVMNALREAIDAENGLAAQRVQALVLAYRLRTSAGEVPWMNQ